MSRRALFAAFAMLAGVARGESGPEQISRLIGRLEDDAPSVREEAEEALLGLGPTAESALKAAMPAAPPESRARIGRILKWSGAEWGAAAEELARETWPIPEGADGDAFVKPLPLDGRALQPVRDACRFFFLIVPDETEVGRHVILVAVWRDRTTAPWDDAARKRLVEVAGLRADGPGRRAIAALELVISECGMFTDVAWKFEDSRLEESGQEIVYRHHRLDVKDRSYAEDRFFEFKQDSLELAHQRSTGARDLNDDDLARLQAADDPLRQIAVHVEPKPPLGPGSYGASW